MMVHNSKNIENEQQPITQTIEQKKRPRNMTLEIQNLVKNNQTNVAVFIPLMVSKHSLS